MLKCFGHPEFSSGQHDVKCFGHPGLGSGQYDDKLNEKIVNNAKVSKYIFI